MPVAPPREIGKVSVGSARVAPLVSSTACAVPRAAKPAFETFTLYCPPASTENANAPSEPAAVEAATGAPATSKPLSTTAAPSGDAPPSSATFPVSEAVRKSFSVDTGVAGGTVAGEPSATENDDTETGA